MHLPYDHTFVVIDVSVDWKLPSKFTHGSGDEIYFIVHLPYDHTFDVIDMSVDNRMSYLHCFYGMALTIFAIFR